MNEKEKLAEALGDGGEEDWKTAAKLAIADPKLEFAGNAASHAKSSVGELLRIYRTRLRRTTETALKQVGLVELIDSLNDCSADAIIVVQPFVGTQTSVTAFWGHQDRLVGCVTINGIDPKIGAKNLDIALGNL